MEETKHPLIFFCFIRFCYQTLTICDAEDLMKIEPMIVLMELPRKSSKVDRASEEAIEAKVVAKKFNENSVKLQTFGI